MRARINGINVGVEEHTATGVRLPTTTGGKARGGTHEIGAGLRDIGCGIVRPGIGHKYIDSRRSNTLAVAGVLLLAAVIQVAVRIELCNVKTFSFELEKCRSPSSPPFPVFAVAVVVVVVVVVFVVVLRLVFVVIVGWLRSIIISMGFVITMNIIVQGNI